MAFNIFMQCLDFRPLGPITIFPDESNDTNLTRRSILPSSGAFLLPYSIKKIPFIFWLSGFGREVWDEGVRGGGQQM